jgi:hypothetical protein
VPLLISTMVRRIPTSHLSNPVSGGSACVGAGVGQPLISGYWCGESLPQPVLVKVRSRPNLRWRHWGVIVRIGCL